MKKILLILLMFVLPLQFSWAAAAVYCQHEQGHVAHFGHHTHQHKAATDDGDGASNKIKKFHGDCEYCHMASHAAVLPDVPALLPTSLQGHVNTELARYTSPIPDTPKRPDWLLVA